MSTITTQVIDIINEVSRTAWDIDMTRWPLPTLLRYINQGQLEAVNLNPVVNPIEGAVQLSSGINQSLPNGGIRLLFIKWNMGISGNTIGNQIVPTSRIAIAKRIPTWTTDAASSVVGCYIYEPQNNLSQFDVYPAQPTSNQGWVWMVYSAIPATIPNVNTGTLITIQDFWKNALVSYCLYRLYDEDSENSNAEKRNHYQSLFLTQLGLTQQASQQTTTGQ